MTIREIAIAQIQQLPESIVQEIIDFITRNHQAKTAISDSLEDDRSEAWAHWFEATNSLEIDPVSISTAPTHEYQQRLLSKYRQQGLNL